LQLPQKIIFNSGISPILSALQAFPVIPLVYTLCDIALGNRTLIEDMKRRKFDLAIVDLPANECALALTHYLSLPTVGFWGLAFNSAETVMTTAYMPASHSPQIYSGFTSEMSFLQRLINFGMFIGNHIAIRGHCLLSHLVIQRHLPGTPNPCTLLRELNGMLINSDEIMDYPQLLPPTFIRVGGLNIKEDHNLPKELEEWMQSSGEAGVVLFAIGSLIDPTILMETFLKAFFKAASLLPQKFLVKLNGDFGEVPENVKIMKWIPQQAVLGNKLKFNWYKFYYI
jgi:glucuronosyltransferase